MDEGFLDVLETATGLSEEGSWEETFLVQM
jgi:hypothetical protein